MSAVPAIMQALLANSGVTALVGTRIDAVQGGQGYKGPSIVVYAASEHDESILSGASDFPEARVSIECIGNRASQAAAVESAVKLALKNLNGVFDGKKIQVFGWAHIASDHNENHTIFRDILDVKCRYRVSA